MQYTYKQSYDNYYVMLYLRVSYITGGGLRTWLSDLVTQMGREQHMRMFAGMSSLCYTIGDYRRGFAEAEEALRIGQCLNHEASCTHFNDLGAYRYIYTFARTNTMRDHYLEQVAAIARYDQGHKRSELLDTLETYLEHGGNIQKTCKLLNIHPNTLKQRLERIQSLCAINVDHYSNRLPLQVAIIIHKLRAPIA
jgi:DNA-binding PucR family transcriptional regulator